MSIKEKLESLGRNSIQLKIARKETYKLGATASAGSRMCRRTSFGPPMRARAMTMW